MPAGHYESGLSPGKGLSPDTTVGKFSVPRNCALRRCDPCLGAFVEGDPMGFAGRILSTNSYAFADPLVFVDPTGVLPAIYSR